MTATPISAGQTAFQWLRKEWGLLAAHAAALLLCVMLAVGHPFRYPPMLLLYGILAGQIGLMAIWTVLGRSPLGLRLTGLFALSVLFGWYAPLTTGYRTEEFAMLFLCEAAVLIVPLIAARLAGVRLMNLAAGAAAAGPLQFSLAQALLWTMAAAAAVRFALWIRWDVAPADCWFGASVGSIGLLAVWAALGRPAPVLRLAVLGFAAPAIGLIYLYLVTLTSRPWPYYNPFPFLELPLLVSTAAAVMAGTMLVTRRWGYRFVKPPRQ